MKQRIRRGEKEGLLSRRDIKFTPLVDNMQVGGGEWSEFGLRAKIFFPPLP